MMVAEALPEKPVKTDLKSSNSFELGYDPTVKISNTEIRALNVPTVDRGQHTHVILKFFFTKNNTHLLVTDVTGEILFKTTGGMNCKNDRDKSSAKTASLICQKALTFLDNKSFYHVIIQFATKGSGRNISYRRFQNYRSIYNEMFAKNPSLLVRKFNIIAKYKKTPVAHGQLRQKGGRRGRRC